MTVWKEEMRRAAVVGQIGVDKRRSRQVKQPTSDGWKWKTTFGLLFEDVSVSAQSVEPFLSPTSWQQDSTAR